MVMPGSTVTTPNPQNKNLYNGQSEWQNQFTNDQPNYYETFYRNYDAAIGRFVGIDPDAESAESLTVYNYSGNNPIMFNDPLGDSYSLPGQSRETYAKDFPFGNGDVNSSFWAGDTGGGSGWNGTSPLLETPLQRNLFSNASDPVSTWNRAKVLGTHYIWNPNVGPQVVEVNEDHGQLSAVVKFEGEWVENNTSNANQGGVINIYRTWETDQSTIDKFSTGSGLSGYILERPGPSTAQSGLRLRIPAGKYNLERSPGTSKDKRLHAEWQLYNDQVSGSGPTNRYILFHLGNYPDDTDGCLIVGFSRGVNFVGGNSKSATDALNNYINSFNGNVTVNIYDPTQP